MDILGEGVDVYDKKILLSEASELDSGKVIQVPLSSIEFGVFQPRTSSISEDSLTELASSIKKQGVLQPILVRKATKGRYQLIAGERRSKAAMLVGLDYIPAIMKEVNKKEAFALAIVENIQRKQLSILEEANALKRLKDEYKFTNEETAQSIGRPRTTVTNLLRLAERLCDNGKKMLEEGIIEFGHARAVLGLGIEAQEAYLLPLKTKKLSVRALEKIIREGGGASYTGRDGVKEPIRQPSFLTWLGKPIFNYKKNKQGHLELIIDKDIALKIGQNKTLRLIEEVIQRELE